MLMWIEQDDDHGDEEEEPVVRLEFAARSLLFIKVQNCILILGLAVAAFLQYTTLDPGYLQTFLSPPVDDDGTYDEYDGNDNLDHAIIPTRISNATLILRSLQSMWTVGLLVFLRAAVFSSFSRHATTLEAILNDLLFHMQCRFVVGLLNFIIILSTANTPVIPFPVMEAAVVCLSIALQQTTATATVEVP